MKKIYFDLDGVIRDLHQAVLGKPADTEENWFCYKDGVDYCSIIDNNKKLLLDAPPTRYYSVVKSLPFISIVTCQPEPWRQFTCSWIYKYFDPFRCKVNFVNHGSEKLALLSENDLLIEDYPLFTDYGKIVLIEYPYNKNVTGCYARINSPDGLDKFLREINQ